MDKKLTPLKGTKRAGARNEKAWLLFSPDGTYCRFCPHADTDHLCSSAQPHFYQLATEQEREDPFLQLYRYNLADGVSVQVKRIIVSKARRAAHRILRRLRTGKEDISGAVLPADAGQRRGCGTGETRRR